ncbi:MAG: superoxide dismutase [Chloroflexota bacterium]|nr:superoxide dismutase [Chloroflexota bacterium]
MTTHFSRRSLLRNSALIGIGLTGLRAGALFAQDAATPTAAPPAPTGPFTLPELPYAFDALVPSIDAMTMEIHHGKHHQAYVDNLNRAVADYPDLQALTIEELVSDLAAVPEEIRTAVQNNGGGHFNHSMFWEIMTPDATELSGNLADAIANDFGSVEEMQAAMVDAGLKRFGSGWSWLVSSGGTLSVVSTPNQDNPLMDGSGTPILGIDVWEHAYYLQYQNRRADYLAAWWDVVNWDAVAERFAADSA